MYKTVLFLFLGLISFAQANVNSIVSILPQKLFVEKIGGDKVQVSLMVKPGTSPHSYEPKPSQMKDIAKAAIYFSIGVEFEKVWLQKFSDQNSKMKIFDVSKGIEKISMQAHSHKNEVRRDTHVWTSPKNVKIIAKNIYDNLVAIDAQNQAYYKLNYDKFLKEIVSTDDKIKEILKDTEKGTKFMVFHPSWGYFANDYGLVQFPIEVEGKEPKPKALAHLIKEAKKENVKAIFTQPEFSDNSAKVIANELNIQVVKVSPLNPKWSQNLINLAKAIANK